MINTFADKIAWKYRRRYLIAVTVFIMALMIFASVGMVAEAVALAIVNNGFWVLATMVGTYVFGAVWDQSNQRKYGVTEKEPTDAPVAS